jgi:hypothetical protein
LIDPLINVLKVLFIIYIYKIWILKSYAKDIYYIMKFRLVWLKFGDCEMMVVMQWLKI